MFVAIQKLICQNNNDIDDDCDDDDDDDDDTYDDPQFFPCSIEKFFVFVFLMNKVDLICNRRSSEIQGTALGKCLRV